MAVLKIVLINCNDWGLIKILKEATGQEKKKHPINEMASWGPRTLPPNRKIM